MKNDKLEKRGEKRGSSAASLLVRYSPRSGHLLRGNSLREILPKNCHHLLMKLNKVKLAARARARAGARAG